MKVYRENKWKYIISDELLPGDLVSIGEFCVIASSCMSDQEFYEDIWSITIALHNSKTSTVNCTSQ